ncbi:MAG: hypothetical protein M0Z53_12035 [Thermaerobacter sp.]|nr:hypothetical protein [Thermaerobacter sp.]
MEKKPISLRDKRRQKTARRRTVTRPAVHRQALRSPGDFDEVLVYWQRWLHNPFQTAGTLPWTERMLWGNALLAGILRAVILLFEQNFNIMLLVSAVLNTLFVFFLVYYAMTFVVGWVLARTGTRFKNMDGLRTETVVLSGWLALVAIAAVIPVAYVLDVALLVFVGLFTRAVMRATRAPWWRSALATLTGSVLVLAVLSLLAHL